MYISSIYYVYAIYTYKLYTLYIYIYIYIYIYTYVYIYIYIYSIIIIMIVVIVIIIIINIIIKKSWTSCVSCLGASVKSKVLRLAEPKSQSFQCPSAPRITRTIRLSSEPTKRTTLYAPLNVNTYITLARRRLNIIYNTSYE